MWKFSNVFLILIGLWIVAQCLYILKGVEWNDNFVVVYCDVGQGQAVLLQKSDMQVLVDVGPRSGGILRCLDAYMPVNDRVLDVVVLTHADADHVGALDAVLDHYYVARMYWNDYEKDSELIAYLYGKIEKSSDVVVETLLSGHTLFMGDSVEINVVWPKEIGENSNENSIIMHAQYGEFEMLLTGDAERGSGEVLRLHPEYRFVDIYNVPHHGSIGSLSRDVMKLMQPSVFVISVGLNNTYGHPDSEVINMVKYDSAASIWRTDLDGDIIIVSDGTSYQMIESAD